jgi:polysaccharide export outer membrane protein
MNTWESRLCLWGLILATACASLSAQTPIARLNNPAPAATDANVPVNVVPSKPHDDHFVIGKDDILAISVWKEPEISRSLPVRPDGKISLPLAGEVEAAGRTPLQLEQEITEKLRGYITDPEVTVMVQQINSAKFNILGEVSRPGSYPLISSTTVLDAIASAGGFRDFAKQKGIYILRKDGNGVTRRIAFDYKGVIKGKHTEQNINLQPDDTIVVP